MRNQIRTVGVALAALLVSGVATLPIGGCGAGGKAPAKTATSRKIGAVTFQVAWPQPSRLIPLAANSIQLRLFRGTAEIATPIVINKPANFTNGQATVSAGSFTGIEVTGTPQSFRVEAVAFPNVGASGTAQASGASTFPLSITSPSASATVTMLSTVTRVDVQPATGPSLRLNATRTFTATCYDASNNIVLVDPTKIAWASSNASAGTLSDTTGSTTTFTATGVGLDTEIRATYTEPSPTVVSAPVLLSVAAKGLSTTGWPKFRGDAQNTGQANASISGNPTGAFRWEFIAGDSLVFASAAVGPLNPITNSWDVFIGSYDNVFYCLDGVTGSEKWSFLTGAAIESSPAISKDGTVYIGSNDGNLYALDAETGTLLWTFTADGAIFGGPTLSTDGGVYFGTTGGLTGAGGTVYKVDAFSGAEIWNVPVGTAIESSPALSRDENTVYVGGRDGKVIGLIASSGAAAPGWPVATGATIFVSSPAVDGAGNVYIGSFDGKLYSIAQAGAINWTFDTGAPIIASPSLVTGATGVASRIYVANYDNVTGTRNSHLFALDSSGAQVWQFPASGSGESIDLISSSPAIGRDGSLYFGSSDGNIYSVSANGSGQWTYATGNIVESSPAFGPDGTLYFGSWNGRVIAVR